MLNVIVTWTLVINSQAIHICTEVESCLTSFYFLCIQGVVLGLSVVMG